MKSTASRPSIPPAREQVLMMGQERLDAIARSIDDSPAGRLRRQNFDGWTNSVTGLGTIARDKRMSAQFNTDYFTQPELELMYRGNDMAARIVDDVPKEMCRMGFVVHSDDKEGAETLAAAAGQGQDDKVGENGLNVMAAHLQALKWKRAYGGGAILMGVDDGQDPILPLDESKIRSFGWMTTLTPEECQPAKRYSDINAAKYGQVELYRLNPIITTAAVIIGPDASPVKPISYNTFIHESRIIAYNGPVVSRRQQALSYNYGWGDSVLMQAWRIIRDFDASWDGASHLLQDFSQGVLKVKGLYELVSSEDASAQNNLANRMMQTDMLRSLLRMLVIDSEEDFERKVTPLSGYSDLLDRFCNRLSATARMPVSRLMGQAPAGLNATGDANIRWYYDDIEFERTDDLRPRLYRTLRLMQLAKDGPTGGKLLPKWQLHLPSLWQLTALEQADQRLKTAQADEIEILNQVVTPEEVAMSRHGGDEWSAHTSLDQDARDELANAQADLGSEGEIPGIDPKAALGGTQVAGLLDIVRAVANGEIPRESGVAMIAASFPVDMETAEKMMADAGQGFEPKVAPPAAGPAGAGPPVPGAEGAPGAPPAPPKGVTPPQLAPHAAATAAAAGGNAPPEAPPPAKPAKKDSKPRRKK